MQLAKTEKTQEKIDTGSGWWRCWLGALAVDINDLICICMSTYVCLSVYKVQPQPHNSRARLRPKLRKSSQHCHFSACFSFFFLFFYGNLSRNNFDFAGAQACARIWHVAKRNNNINSNKTLGMRRRQGGRGTGRGNAHSYRGVCQSVSQTQYAYQLPFSPLFPRYSFIH